MDEDVDAPRVPWREVEAEAAAAAAVAAANAGVLIGTSSAASVAQCYPHNDWLSAREEHSTKPQSGNTGG